MICATYGVQGVLSIGVLGIDISSVYVHSCIVICCIFHRCNWSGGYMYPQYMCILLYVIVIWCNGISEIYCQLEWGRGRCILSICASAICESYLV